MTAPSQRRREPQPIGRGGELAAAAIGGALIAVALTALTGLGVASAGWGDGWVWPHGATTVTSVLGGLLRGHPGRGLPPDQLRRVPGPVPVYLCIAFAELALLAAAIGSAVLVARHRRPGDTRRGMATRREAAEALGLRALRASRSIIRPDRYPPRGGRGRLLRLLSTGHDGAHEPIHRRDAGAAAGSTVPAPSTETNHPTMKEPPR